MEARAACEILKCLIIHWKREAAEISREAFLEGKLLISIEESSSKQQADPFHYVTTIAFAGSMCGDLVPKKFLKEIQSLLSGFSGKLTWPSEKAHCSQDLSGLASFQMKFEADEKPTTLMTDCLVIKQFLHKTSIVHPKIRFHFYVKVNGVLSQESFGVQKEPVVKLLNGIGLLTSQHHYTSQEHPLTVFDDNSYLFDWKKYHLCAAPNLNSLEEGPRSVLLTHLNGILLENHGRVQGAVQRVVDQALGQHRPLDKAQQKWQESIPVAVSAILSIVAGSTSSGFRALCLQMLQATDTQEFRLRLLEAFQRTLPQRFLHHSPCDPQKVLPEPSRPEEEEDGEEEPVPGSCRPGEGRRPKRSRRGERPREPPRAGPDPLWLREVSNLSEWLSGPGAPQ